MILRKSSKSSVLLGLLSANDARSHAYNGQCINWDAIYSIFTNVDFEIDREGITHRYGVNKSTMISVFNC